MRTVLKNARGLFWKIFVAFWLANLIIMAVTTYVVTKSLETQKIDPNQKLFITDMVREVVWHYERDINIKRDMDIRQLIREYTKKRKTRLPPYSIANDANQIIYRYRMGMVPEGHVNYNFSFVSVSGNVYRIDAFVRSPQVFALNGLKRLNKLQLILVLFASALVSLILSWSISNPLKKLGKASRNFTGGGELDIEQSLLTRHDEIGDLSRDFKYMSKEVEKNIESQKQLLHDVSHELRAPLARLQTTAGLIQQKNPEDSKHIDRMHVECEKISSLIQNILNYSRMDQSAQVSEIAIVSDIVESLLDNVRYEFSARQIEFVNPLGDLRAQLFPELLETALGNILRNACKHTMSPIVVTLNRRDGLLEIEVRDFGEGVNNEELEQLLMPFYRTGNKMHSDGHGLGLSIAKRAMEKLGGSIELWNHPEGGLVVKLSFPHLLPEKK